MNSEEYYNLLGSLYKLRNQACLVDEELNTTFELEENALFATLSETLNDLCNCLDDGIIVLLDELRRQENS